MLALLITAATGAWAQDAKHLITATYGEQTRSLEQPLPYATTVGVLYEAVTGKSFSDLITTMSAAEMPLSGISSNKTDVVSIGDLNDASTPVTVKADGEATIILNFSGYNQGIFVSVTSPLYVTMKDGTQDAAKWTATVGTNSTANPLPVGGLNEGDAVTLQYSGRLKVKGVKATSDAAPAANPNAYLKWDGTQKKLVATPMPESFTTVTSENTEWSAGTYVVEGQVDITSSIELSGDVNLIIKDGAKLTVYHLYGNSHNLSIYGQAQMTGELDVFNSGGDAINEIPTLEVHSAKVTATSSSDYSGGFGDIGTFNVYGGLVDAKNTGSQGFGILLKECGYMNIYGGEVKAEVTGNDRDVSYGITSSASISSDAAYVRVYGGKLWAGNANNRALNDDGIYLTKGTGFTGKIEYSSDNSNWSEEEDADTKYVRVGY